MLWRCETKRSSAREIAAGEIYSRRGDDLNAKML